MIPENPTQEELDLMTTAEATAHIMACKKEQHKCDVCTYIKTVLTMFKDSDPIRPCGCGTAHRRSERCGPR